MFGEEGSERGTLLAHLVLQPAPESRRTPLCEILFRCGYRLFLCDLEGDGAQVWRSRVREGSDYFRKQSRRRGLKKKCVQHVVEGVARTRDEKSPRG